MKQVLQSLSDGTTEIANVPAPKAGTGHLLIATSKSLVSVGTERMLVEFGNASLIGKARQQPDKVRMVLNKVKTDGLAPTIDAVRNKLDEPLPLGYCNVGKVIEVGNAVAGFAPGDRIASNGKHAEIVSIPLNLCAKIPDNVDDEEAAFTVIGAIALQGIRLIQPTLGETIVVTGLGLVGLMTVQLLKANGCRVIGIDFDAAKLKMAEQFGAETVNISDRADPVQAAMAFTGDRGVDGVIVTASTKSSEPMSQAAHMCRKRGRIVLVGVTGLELSRADFFEKELTFQVSCSYGPGRYDTNYEDRGQDYPIGYVRWTEQRNFEAVLELMSNGSIDVKSLISHRYSIDDAVNAYKVVGGSEPSLGILLEYGNPDGTPTDKLLERTIQISKSSAKSSGGSRVSFIGSGNYAKAVLIPAFKSAGADLVSVVSGGGVSAVHAARKFGIEQAKTDASEVFSDNNVDAVVISTRHNSHAGFVLAAIDASKHVFVEKPLCLTLDELDQVENVYQEVEVPPLLMVGFNRRFSPHVQKIKNLISTESAPKSFIMTVNAGNIPADHWTQDRKIGGGRIIGEACHFIDLLRYLANAPIVNFSVSGHDTPGRDTVSISLEFEDGSNGTIHYLANGNKGFPKERLEVFCAGKVLQLNNFRTLQGWGWKGFSKMKLWRQDKGQSACAKAFMDSISNGGEAPISANEIFEISRITIKIATTFDA